MTSRLKKITNRWGINGKLRNSCKKLMHLMYRPLPMFGNNWD